MKRLAILLLFPGTAFAQPQEPSFGAWKYVQAVTITKAGLNRLDLPPATLNAAQANLEDIRLIDSEGRQVPFIVEGPIAAITRQPVAENFHASLQGDQTVLTFDTGTNKPIETLILETPARDFVKAVSVEGSNDGKEWTTLVANEMIFRQPTGAGRTSLALGVATPWKHARATINDSTSSPVPFTGARIIWSESRSSRVPLDVTLKQKEELSGKTRLTLDLGAINLRLSEITLHVADQLFTRQIEVQQHGQTISRSQIHRLRVNNRLTEELTIPVLTQIHAKEITVTVINNDSLPLRVEGITATRDPVGIAFHANTNESLRLFSGHLYAPPPRYDLELLADDLRQANTSSASVGGLQPNPEYQGDPLDSVLVGASIQLSDWSYRRSITPQRQGVVAIGLDPLTLSRSNDQNDIRIVQNGVQLPYRALAMESQEVRTEIKAAPDSKRPSISRWRVILPYQRLPVDTLVLSSPSTIFERNIRVFSEDNRQQPYYSAAELGSYQWRHANAQEPDLKITLPTRWRGDSILIEADNGDNAPIQLSTASAYVPSTRLIFRTATVDAIYLYYGNPKARFPRYDASLVDSLMFGNQLVGANLGPEEVISSNPAFNDTPKEATSPWLWMALSVVVIGLIAVMAKLLPKAETPA